MTENNQNSNELEQSPELDNVSVNTAGNDGAVEHEADDSYAIVSAIKQSSDDDDDDWWKDDDEYSAEQHKAMEQMYEGTLRSFSINEIVTGTVVSKTDKEVLLNIGFKSEGIIPLSEFRDLPSLSVGDSVDVLIETTEDKGGQLKLSRKLARVRRAWDLVNRGLEEQFILVGQILRRTKGGFVVDIEGLEAFLPGSQIDVKPVRDFDQFVGRTMEFKVVKINHQYENVVVSHKILIEDKIQEQRQEILKNLEKGQILEGTVKNMTQFGVFIDLGGVDGLLHITDISWGRVNHPQEVLKLEDKVTIVVLDFDEEKKRISLGMKQLTPHPWDTLPEDITEGTRIQGRVVTVADYGIFIEVKPGVEGLIHTSEMSWSQHPKTPSEMFKVGQELEAVVLNIDRNERKMSLGLKQLNPDPWTVESVIEKYAPNTRHTGTVRNMTNYGLFVELEDGVDGLVHISDLSWTKKFTHPSEYIKLEEPIEVVVLAIDVENRKLSLGHKQLTEDVWNTFESIFGVGTIQKGTVRKIDGRGALVELEYGVEGFVPSKHLKVAEGQPELAADTQADFEVIEFNKDTKRITLSHTNTWNKEEADKKPKKTTRTKKEDEAGAEGVAETEGVLSDNEALASLKEKLEGGE